MLLHCNVFWFQNRDTMILTSYFCCFCALCVRLEKREEIVLKTNSVEGRKEQRFCVVRLMTN